MIGKPPDCLKCKHFSSDDKNGFTCKAYPDGIPDAISTGIVLHDEPYPGDNGIRFEPMEQSRALRS